MRPRSAFRAVGVLLVLTGGLAAREASARGFTPFLRYVPKGANAALFNDVQTLEFNDAQTLERTPLAKEHGWFERTGEAGRPFYIPEAADLILVAPCIDPVNRLAPAWDVALLRLSKPFDLVTAAKAEGGYVDRLGGREVVWAPSGAYLVPLEPQTLGQYVPAERQAAARWITSVAPPTRPAGEFSEYLTLASQSVGPKTPVVFSFDFTDAFPPHNVRAGVMAAQGLNVDDARRTAIGDALVSIRGATIILNIHDDAHATVRFDLAGKVDASAASRGRF